MSDDPSSSSKKRSLWRNIARMLRRRELDQDPSDVDPVELLREREAAGDDLDRDQKDMIVKVAAFDRLRVSDVMVPRADIVAVEVSETLGDVARLFASSQHSRMPIFRENLDNPIGMAHVKDVLGLLAPPDDGLPVAHTDDLVLNKLKRDLLFVPPSMKLPSLLLKMRLSRCHMALVVDEYGGTDGLVSIEDLVEQIVGEIDDEHDDDADPEIVMRGDGVWEADARAEIADISEAVGTDLMLEDREDDIDTLGGLAVALIGRVPLRGEILRHPIGFDFEIIDADPRRIRRIRLRRLAVDVAAKTPVVDNPAAQKAPT